MTRRLVICSVACLAVASGCSGKVTVNASQVDSGVPEASPGDDAVADATDGGACQSAAGTWLPMSSADAPWGSDFEPAVWTGSELDFFQFGVGAPDNGGRYHLATDSWSMMFAPPWFDIYQTAPAYPNAWSGSEWLIWGADYQTGGRFDPAKGHWARMTDVGAPSRRSHTAGAWVGDRFLVWGGEGETSDVGPRNDGALYDPVTDSWTPTTMVGAPSPRYNAMVVSIGNRAIILSGNTGAPTDDMLPDGAVYDPAADAWQPMNMDGTQLWSSHRFVWTGEELILWESSCAPTDGYCEAGVGFGYAYSPTLDQWRKISSAGAPSNRDSPSVVWTGTKMIVWGGSMPTSPLDALGDGGIYDPKKDSWTPIPTMPCAPRPRAGHLAVWTGSSMIVWGGTAPNTLDQYVDGGIFVPAQ